MASTAITVKNHTPYIINVRVTVCLVLFWEWANLRLQPHSTVQIGTEWWWYDVAVTAAQESLDAMMKERYRLLELARKEGVTLPGDFIYSSQKFRLGIYGGTTLYVLPGPVDKPYTEFARKFDANAEILTLDPLFGLST